MLIHRVAVRTRLWGYGNDLFRRLLLCAYSNGPEQRDFSLHPGFYPIIPRDPWDYEDYVAGIAEKIPHKNGGGMLRWASTGGRFSRKRLCGVIIQKHRTFTEVGLTLLARLSTLEILTSKVDPHTERVS